MVESGDRSPYCGRKLWRRRGTGSPRARVARMLHGVADSYCQPLRLLRNILRHMRHENGGYRCRHFQIYVVISRWWGRQDSNLRRHSQRIYSPPPLPLGTLPRSRRTVLISKDKSGSPAGRSGCIGLMREQPPPSQWMVSVERLRARCKQKESRRWERRLFSVRLRVELRVI